MKWVVINNDSIVEAHLKGTKPAALNNLQSIVRVTKENEIFFKDHIKYDSDQIKLIRQASETAQEKIVGSLPVQAFSSKKTLEGYSLFKRVHGMGKITIDHNEVADIEFQVSYKWAKLQALEIMTEVDGIEADLFIEDSDEGLYTGVPRYELNQFGFGVNIPLGYYRKSSNFDSDLYEDMWVVLQLTNKSGITQTISANVELNEVRK